MGRGREEREKLPLQGVAKITLEGGGAMRGKGASVLVGGTPNLGFHSMGEKHNSS